MVSWNAELKNIETHLVLRLGPRTGAEAGAEREAQSGGRSGGPSAQPRHQYGFQFFDFLHFMNTTQGFQVFMQNMREYHQKFQK